MRQHLHQYPEISHGETETAAYIVDFLEQFDPDQLITGLGGHGIAAIYEGEKEGPAIMIRCELDALPIREGNTKSYRSKYEDKGHLCGHDGHMVMVAGLAPLFSASRPEKGKVILFFQPAEETGEGARKVLDDPQFSGISPDYVFALHNLPGYDKSSVIIKNGVFASASKGLIIKLNGTSSHAGHPEGGNNPSTAVALILQTVQSIPQRAVALHEAALVTPIHIRVGNPAFGTSPGDGEIMFTIRAHSNEVMESLEKKILHEVRNIATAHNLSFNSKWTEPFESVDNDDETVALIRKCANELDLKVIEKEIPFPWSEDFGVLTSEFKGALFGLGSGTNAPQLHHPNYDFPDDIIESGISMFYNLVLELSTEE